MDEQNPYRSSSAGIVDEVLVRQVESASKRRRFFNWLIDSLMVVGLIVLALLLAIVLGGDAVAQWIEGIGAATDYAISYATMLVYYTLMEGVFGVTIGKLVTGTRVVDAHGRRLTFSRGLLRSLCRFIPFDAISLLFSDDDVRRAWHDSITRTYVVRRRPVPLHPSTTQGFTVSDSTTMSST